jgi:1-acyl-sn-glycerol-3-phosphate acyltransferase
LSNAGKDRMGRARAGVAWLALRSRVPVIPALILGGPQTYKIRPSWVCPSRVRVIVGQPVDLSAYRGRKITRPLLEEVNRRLKDQILDLGKGRPGRRGWEFPGKRKRQP